MVFCEQFQTSLENIFKFGPTDQIWAELELFHHTLYHARKVIRETYGLAALVIPEVTWLRHIIGQADTEITIPIYIYIYFDYQYIEKDFSECSLLGVCGGTTHIFTGFPFPHETIDILVYVLITVYSLLDIPVLCRYLGYI